VQLKDPEAGLSELLGRYTEVSARDAVAGRHLAEPSRFTSMPRGSMEPERCETSIDFRANAHDLHDPIPEAVYRPELATAAVARPTIHSKPREQGDELMNHGRSRTLGLLAALILLAACVREGEEGQPTAPTGPQELQVGFTEDQYVLEGPDARLGMYPLNANIVETLLVVTPNYEVRPLLAESLPELLPPNTYRFKIRKGIRFHDGQTLNATAVKEMFDRQIPRRGGGTIKAGPDSAKIVDEYTIDFTPTAPNFRVPEQIAHPSYGITAPGSVIGQKPVGTGPFRFVEYLPKERIVVERNPEYWGTKPKLDKITFRFFPDSNARVLALRSGDLDFAYQINRPDVQALESRGFKVAKSSVGAYRALYLNIHGKPGHELLSDVRIRKAIAYAIDRKEIVDGVLDGLATTDQTFVPPQSLGEFASLVKGFAYDPARARALLEEAGWKPGPGGIREKDGRPLKLTLVSGFPAAEIHRPLPTFLQAQLKEVGIDTEIVERPDSTSYQSLIDTGDGDIFLEEGNQNEADPGFLPTLLFYSGGSGSSAPYLSLFGPGQRFDDLLAPSRTEADPDKVRKSVAEAMHQMIDEDTVVIALAGIYRIYGMKESVQGFTPHPSFLNVRWDGVSIGG
jgi:peptide/nickel transport system substrate-binding protein